MKQQRSIITAGLILLLSACAQDDRQEPDSPAGIIHFTAVAGALETKSTGNPLADGANVTVHAWNLTLSEKSASPVLSNNYTVQNNSSAGDNTLKENDAPMQVQTGVTYFFYALSTNSATEAVPVLNGSYRTTALKNGVDYLIAVPTSGFSSSGSKVTVPLSFRHLATQIKLTVKPATEDGYLSAAGLSVSIADTDPTGSFIELLSGGSIPGGIPGDFPNGQKLAATKNETEFTVSFIVLPIFESTRGIPLKLEFTNLSFETDQTIASKSYTASILPKAEESSLTLQGGYSYEYEVTIRRYSASFSLPKVEPWELYGVDMDKMEEVIEVDPE